MKRDVKPGQLALVAVLLVVGLGVAYHFTLGKGGADRPLTAEDVAMPGEAGAEMQRIGESDEAAEQKAEAEADKPSDE